jgi:alpha-D-ribose 1-methylphosphonate 5-triphosphate diphosphatase
MTRETVFTNTRVVLGDETVLGSVLVRDGVIADITTGPATTVGEDLDGDHLMPGVVELHTDHLEYHFSPRPGVSWDPLPAVLAHDAQLSAAGATTVFDAVRIGSEPDGRDGAAAAAHRLAEAVESAMGAGLLRAEHAIHMRCEVSSADCLDAFHEFDDDQYVRLASLMDHTPGQRQYADIEDFKRYYLAKRRVSEADFEQYVRLLHEQSALHSGRNRRAIAGLAAERGITLAAHDDATPEHVAESVSLGVHISEFPTTVVAAQAAVDQGLQVVMGAPNIVRGGSQSGNVAAAELLDLGLLDVLSSDYVPSSPLHAVFQLVADGVLTMAQGARLISTNPARAVGLDDRGEIAVGKRADLVRVATHGLPADERRPNGRSMPVVRGVYRTGERVS